MVHDRSAIVGGFMDGAGCNWSDRDKLQTEHLEPHPAQPRSPPHCLDQRGHWARQPLAAWRSSRMQGRRIVGGQTHCKDDDRSDRRHRLQSRLSAWPEHQEPTRMMNQCAARQEWQMQSLPPWREDGGVDKGRAKSEQPARGASRAQAWPGAPPAPARTLYPAGRPSASCSGADRCSRSESDHAAHEGPIGRRTPVGSS